jgi:vacuolar protein sorting-associated protein 13A/C
MFEKLLEKIIMSYFGDFLNGIDENNLHVGIWNGNISIENVSLNEQKINHLMIKHKLPFLLNHSHIGGLRIIVPWNKLSSMPVEITLTNVYLFLKMKDTDTKIELQDIINNQKELIKKYCEYLTKKLFG